MSSRSFGAVRPALWLVIGLLSMAWFVVAASVAQAAPKGVVATIGEDELIDPIGVAVNDTSGDVYVVDQQAHSVLRYSSSGEFLSSLGGQGEAGGQLFFPYGVSVDQGAGSLWVSDGWNSRAQRFDPLLLGQHPFSHAIGWDVIDGGGTEFEVCSPSDTCKKGTEGTGDGQFGFFIYNTGAPAVDSARNDVYVPDPGNSRIQRFDATTGEFEAAFGSSTLGSPGPSRLAVDSTGAVYAVDDRNNRVVRCYSVGGTPEEFFCTTFAADLLSGTNAFDLAIDRTDNHVYVARRPQGEGFDPTGWPVEIAELTPGGELVEIHGRHQEVVNGTPTWVSDEIKHPDWNPAGNTGLAVNSNTGAIYLSIRGAHPAVLVFGDVPQPPDERPPAAAMIDPASGIGTHSATVNGSVDPNGYPTSYQFQYRIGSAPWTRVPGNPPGVGSGADEEPVTETLTGLQPDATYQVRLAAVRPWGPGDAMSDVVTFTTGGVPPEVDAQRAAADDTSVALEARIDANNNPTTYFFEYGLDTGYGSETPERDGGEGADPVKRIERVTGLQPNTTYHYRAVAENASGTAEGPDKTFTTDATGAAPDGRAYELVTPAGGVAELRTGNGGWRPSTPDGNHVCIGSAFDIAGSDPSGGTQVDDAYCAHRGAGGWSFEWIAQPRGAYTPPQSPVMGASVRWITDDGARKVWVTDFKGVVPGRPPHQDDGFDGYLRADGQTQWVTPTSPVISEYRHPLAASKDLSHVVYHVGSAVWEWTEADGARQVSMVEDEDPAPPQEDTPATGNANLGGSDWPLAGYWALPTTISDDGSRIFFESMDALESEDAGGRDVYVRENGETTRLLSERRGPASTEDVFFAGASENGEVAYLQTDGQLTPDAKAGTALYRYTLASDELELVEDNMTNALAVSGDGSSVVFSGTNVLDPGDGLSLYVNRDGTTTRIAPLDPSDVSPPYGDEHRVGAPNHVQRALRVTADGSVVVFRAESTTPGVPGVHRWAAGEGLTTVSEDQDGSPVPAEFGNRARQILGIDINAGRGMTHDGETVFFETSETLSPRDVNGDTDVYAWNDGKVRLITPGADHEGDVRYLDNSADGSTVFFTTYERILSRQDTNSARDLYAARVGGGFPDLPPSTVGDPPPGPSGGPPPPPAPGSEGAGDQASDPRPALSASKPSVAALRAAARSGRLPLRISLTGGGKVRVRATAVLRGKRRTVATGSQTVRRAGRTPVRLTLRLSTAARRELRRRGSLRIRIAVNGSRVLEDAQLTVVLRRSKGGR